ncbi:iron permease [Martelella alba]|uniref:Iron permease n=1 Tax=Martelella alba TaxID=2590451 RepID=A0ABY2SLR3_9HYPH|nr:iron permease [Martelella alba]
MGLREGLEAALIVGIIAAFLRKNGKRLTAMWWGVILAVLLSVIVGVGLDLAEQALPQARQEGMESIIGGVAVFFVTGMIVWMNNHAQNMRRQLEAEAAAALSQASAYALASMAFLAVLKEGFETSVFLLATFSASQSAALAAAGAIIGLLLAVAIGWGIYIGGVKINLSRFFRFTGAFLILVAAGLVISSLRTAHEAGWLNIGQRTLFNLSWLVAPGSIHSALITGVLGIPADPRRVELAGWLAYLICVAFYLYWPHSLRPGPRKAARWQIAAGAALLVVAWGLFSFYPTPRAHLAERATIVGITGDASPPIGSLDLTAASGKASAMLKVSVVGARELQLPLPKEQGRRERDNGRDLMVWTIAHRVSADAAPGTVTLDDVVALNGGRIPIGLSPQQHPGPYNADWSIHCSTRVGIAQGLLVDASSRSNTLLTLSGSGLQTPRTLTVKQDGNEAALCRWRVSDAYRARAEAEWDRVTAADEERHFWAGALPVMLVIAAAFFFFSAIRILIRRRRAGSVAAADVMSPRGHNTHQLNNKGATHAEH